MKSMCTDLPDYDLIFVDAMNQASISFYAKRNLSYNGRPTGMVYGVLQQLVALRRRYPTAKICFLWEGHASVRKAKYAVYKSQRKPKESDFMLSVHDLEAAIQHVGVYQARHVGLEADDLAAYYCNKYKESKILLVSNDRDWWGCVRPGISVFMKNEEYTYEDLMAELQFPPNKISLLKVLRGDSSDGVQGIPRFPTVLALRLAKLCDSVDDFIPTLEKTAATDSERKWLEVLKSSRDVLTRNAELLQYHPEWIREADLTLTKPAFNPVELSKLMTELGLFSLLPKFCLATYRE